MKSIILLFLIMILNISLPAYSAINICAEVLSHHVSPLITFYNDMVERGVLNINDLQKVKEALEKGNALPNPFLNSVEQNSNALNLIRSTNLIAAINHGYSPSELHTWLEREIDKTVLEDGAREKVSTETKSYFEPVLYHRIEAGSFNYLGEYWIELSQPFKMQSSHVTQGQWEFVMGVNPSVHQYKDGEKNFERPIENITIWSAMEFANRLSIAEGLEPVYDLSEFDFTGSPEDGSYEVSLTSKGQIKINAPGGDIYKAKGYRLPTRAEYYMVLTNRGEFEDDYGLKNFVENDGFSRSDYFHFSTHNNIFSKTIEGGSLRAYQSNGHSFYDLLGNVAAFTSDTNLMNNRIIKGVNPRSSEIDYQRFHGFLLSGSSYTVRGQNIFEAFESQDVGLNTRSEQIGFRLVRSLEE